VTPGYIDTVGIRMIRGRGIEEQDTPTSPRVAMVNEYFATHFLPDVDPISQKILVEELIPGRPRGQMVECQIVGVFRNLRGPGSRDDYPEIDVSFWQNPWPRTAMVVRTDSEPKGVISAIAAAVNTVDPDLPLAGVKTIDQIIDEAAAIDRFSVVLFSSFGALGLLLAAVGIYGVMAFGVTQRTHEFGVRMALGAQGSNIVKLVLKEGTILAAIGAALGLAGAYFVGRAMQSTLYGVGALDFQAFGAVSLLLLIAALLACLLPALRASKVEPVVALRHE
jgi:putative ABC transport system permease protein